MQDRTEEDTDVSLGSARSKMRHYPIPCKLKVSDREYGQCHLMKKAMVPSENTQQLFPELLSH